MKKIYVKISALTSRDTDPQEFLDNLAHDVEEALYEVFAKVAVTEIIIGKEVKEATP